MLTFYLVSIRMDGERGRKEQLARTMLSKLPGLLYMPDNLSSIVRSHSERKKSLR